nr:type II secretion system protein [uncultured Blautia sp.]
MKYKIWNRNDGFTLAELLITVAIIGVLVAIGIPVLFNQLEKSREATDLANVRAAYAEVMTAQITGDEENQTQTVKLKQKKDDWESDPVTVAGITHYKKDGNTPNWKGAPGADGECKITYNASIDTKTGEPVGICFEWSGSSGNNGNDKNDEDNGNNGENTKPGIDFSEDVHKLVEETGLLSQHKTPQFEIDSKSPNSSMVKAVREKLGSNSLLNYGTWAYLADSRDNPPKGAYLFWTAVDTNAVGAGQKIPVIVSSDKGGYYISETTTANRTNKSGVVTHVAIAGHMPNYSYFKDYTKGTRYSTMEEAYKAYTEMVENGKYSQEIKDSLNDLPK